MLAYEYFLLNYTDKNGFISFKKLIKDVVNKKISTCLIKSIKGDNIKSDNEIETMDNFIPLVEDKNGKQWILNKKDNTVWLSKLDKINIVDVYNASTNSFLDKDGLNYLGYNVLGFNKKGLHKNGTIYDDFGYDKNLYNEYGYHKDGSFDKEEIKIYQKWKGNIEALKLIDSIDESDSITFLTGKAGTGKTTLMKDLIDHFKYKGTPPLVLASTGLASVNIGGQTVHSFFGLPITNPHHSEIKMKIKKDKLKTLVDSSFIIIDEISMLSSNILDCIDQKIRILTADYFGDNSLKQKPFGGKKILFVGDLFQLPPIVQDERKVKFKEIYNSEFFFDSLSIKNSPYEVIELQENYRQGDDIEFGNILDRIREGEFDRNDITKINTRVSSEIENFGILLTTTNKTADDFNSTKLGLIDKPIYSFYANISGVFPNNMKKVPDILDLKEGAQIIMLNNNPYKQWVNGDLGIIEEIDEENGIIKVLINNKSFDVETVQFKNIEVRIIDEETSILDDNGKEKKLKRKKQEEEIIGTYEQFPMKLARAITIHKSQGLTFDQCCIDMGNGAFAKGQTYVALSRCRNLNGIKLKRPLYESDIKTDQRVIEFMKKTR